MIKSGVRAKLTCVDTKLLSADFVGREFDEQLLSEFPPHIDHCGENGEFHTFVYAGPMFQHDLAVEVGEIVSRDEFVFADLNLDTTARTPINGSFLAAGKSRVRIG